MSITLYEAKQPRQFPSIRKFLEDLQKMKWATLTQLRVWYFGEDKDNGRIWRLSNRLYKADRVRREPYGKGHAYAAKRHKWSKYAEFLDHGIGVTEGLVRLWRADPHPKTYTFDYEYKTQKPEFGITYSTGTTLLYEFCTYDNIRTLKTKIRGYEEIMSPKQLVLFVCNCSEEYLLNRITRYQPQGPFYFTDYETFKTVPIGQQLTARIYYTPELKKEGLRDA